MVQNQRVQHITAKREQFRAGPGGKQTELFFLSNDAGIEMAVSNFGARVIQLWIPDRKGVFEDIVLGHNNLQAYMTDSGGRFYGAVIGHYANRIANGRLSINDTVYDLPKNDGENTPMDFREARPIGSRLHEDFGQLRHGHGYDHNWVLNHDREGELLLAASIYEPVSGRYMEVRTTQPGMQFYGGNYFDGSAPGKRGKPYTFRSGLAPETQHFPDSPNHPGFPGTVLYPGEEYKHECIYKIGIK